MEGLKNAREETGKTRAEFGAVDLRSGEVEGMQGGSGGDGSGGGGTSKSAALEKRKRDLEERRKLVDAKRRKKLGNPPVAEPPLDSSLQTAESRDAVQTTGRPPEPRSVKAIALNPADDFLAQLEREIMPGGTR